MKKLVPAICMCSMLLGACMKDTVSEKYVIFKPVYKSKDEVLAQVKTEGARNLGVVGKLCVKDHYVFVSEPGQGVHIIDFANPAAPVNLSFANIPGNYEIAVRDHYLYANCFSSLVILDIADPVNIRKVTVLQNVFPEKTVAGISASDASTFLVSWERKDTTIKEPLRAGGTRFGGGVVYAMSSAPVGNPAAMNGSTGSMSGMALLDERMYAISGNDIIRIFNIASAASPVFTQQFTVHNGTGQLETIFPFNRKLFIGAQAGISIYDLGNPDVPAFQSKFAHATVCDPVIADNDHAYITLRSGTVCQGVTNTLDVLDIHTLTAPRLLHSYQMTNPHGLSKDGNLLFVCDGRAGLKIFEATPSGDLQLSKQFPEMEAIDVLASNGLAVCVARGGLYFIDYTTAQYSVKGRVSINP